MENGRHTRDLLVHALHEDDVLLNDPNAEEQIKSQKLSMRLKIFNKDKIASDEVPDIIQNRDTQNEALNSQPN